MKFFLAALCISSLLLSPIYAAVKAYDNNNTQLVARQTGNRIDITLPVNHQSRVLTAKIIALAGTGLTYLLGTIYEKSAHHAATNHQPTRPNNQNKFSDNCGTFRRLDTQANS